MNAEAVSFPERGNQVAVVTAAGDGIGRETALRLACAGVGTVIAVDLNYEMCQTTSDLIVSLGAKSQAFAIDCTNLTEIQEAFEEIIDRYGRVDILVNGVGSSGREKAAEFDIVDLEVVEMVVATSLMSAIYCSRQVVGGMKRSGFGRIVNISSGVGQKPQVGLVDYAAAKAGVVGFTRGLALELCKHGITVNAISPGAISTIALQQMPPDVMASIKAGIPMGRLGKPEEIAATIEFLCKEEAAYITGQTVSVNGGWFMN